MSVKSIWNSARPRGYRHQENGLTRITRLQTFLSPLTRILPAEVIDNYSANESIRNYYIRNIQYLLAQFH